MLKKSSLWLFAALAVVALVMPGHNALTAQAPVDADAIFKDAAAPVTGNPKGDLTIVEFSDYNCPFCKRSAAALEKLAKEDNGLRIIHKDWPVLSEASIAGARMALAAGYQGKYAAAHAALMEIPGMRISQEQMRAAIAAAGVDMARLDADLKAHGAEIDALLARNADQAEALGLQGTPAFLIGRYIVPSALDYSDFKQAVAEARTKAKKD